MDCGVTVEQVRGILNVASEPTRDEQIGWALDAACALWIHMTDRIDPENPELAAQVTAQGRQFVTLAAVRYFSRFDAPFGVAGGFETGAVYVMRHDPDLASLLIGDRVGFGIA